jgi:hypothetical protein
MNVSPYLEPPVDLVWFVVRDRYVVELLAAGEDEIAGAGHP